VHSIKNNFWYCMVQRGLTHASFGKQNVTDY
jgi:hypothetical protein